MYIYNKMRGMSKGSSTNPADLKCGLFSLKEGGGCNLFLQVSLVMSPVTRNSNCSLFYL